MTRNFLTVVRCNCKRRTKVIDYKTDKFTVLIREMALRVKTLLTVITIMFSHSGLGSEKFGAIKYQQPLREVSVIVSEDGFYPSKIMAYEGEKIKFFVTSTNNTGHCFVLQKHNVFISAQKGRVGEGETIVDKAGRYKFYCPANKSTGYLTVFKKFNPEEKTQLKRDVASEKVIHWMPRDYD